MISVIVPIYKVEKYIRKCVESIINQTYRDLEIILVDDGSPDRCGEICDDYAAKDKRIVVIHQENKGPSAARNAGIEAANGEYITFVDGDDRIDAKMYEYMVSAIERWNVDLAICSHKIIKDGTVSKAPQFIGFLRINNADLWEEVLGHLNNAVWNKIYLKRKIEDLRFPEDTCYNEDLLFNLHYIAKCESGVITKMPLYYYCMRDDSITRSAFNKNKLLEIYAKDRVKTIVEQSNPRYTPAAEKYCFRARMNVLRAIYGACVENEYEEQVTECREYVKSNYGNVKKNLRAKERIEYWLMENSLVLYKRMNSIRAKIRH